MLVECQQRRQVVKCILSDSKFGASVQLHLVDYVMTYLVLLAKPIELKQINHNLIDSNHT